MTEESLSDLIVNAGDVVPRIPVIKKIDVKEAVKKLKEFEYYKTMGGIKTNMILISFKDLDKIFGDKLI